MTFRRPTLSRAARVVVAAALAACTKRTPPPASAPAPASGPAAVAARDRQYADDYRRTLVAYYQRVEWSYAGGRCAVTDTRASRTTPFQCGRIRVGTVPDANVTDLVREIGGRTVDLHPGEAPWRRVVVPTESERAAILKLLADERVRWAGLDFQPPAARPAPRPRRARPARAKPSVRPSPQPSATPSARP
jgi:hypothetical protein